MFGQIDKIDEMKDKLNDVSPSFCMAKWMHVTMHLLTGHTHSCYLPPTHKIPLEEIKKDPTALHNTNHKKQMRKMMKEGQRPEECGICWGVEDLPGNHYSDRHYRGVDDWTMPFFEKVKNMNWDENINPTYVEVSFSSACNFKCSYCSPAVSTEWMKEIKREGSYKLSDLEHQYLPWFEDNGQMPIPEDENPYLEAFWKWWPDLIGDLMHFRITGGEPLLSKNTFRVLEWLREHPAPQLNLSINSNLGIPKSLNQKFIDAMKDIMENDKVRSHILHTSLDAWGAQAEYIRSGLKMDRFMENLDAYMTQIPNGSIAFMSTFNNLSVVGYQSFLEQILEMRQKYNNDHREVLLDIPHLQAPHHQSCQILTPDFIDYMESHIDFMNKYKNEKTGFKDAEIYKMTRIMEWMKEEKESEWLETHRKNFYLFFNEHDRRRGTDFLTTFPEMDMYWSYCKNLALGKTAPPKPLPQKKKGFFRSFFERA
ncbi:MAG: radical SAM protein [Bdellovibrionaceae bacterium]|nr:radical SAM protein [Pseudobdellovibrionaceae bacterium]|tara:strand:+ start:16296 stop:17738 length:1443 start_codon:yes stop_codon:yes gene_type:complete